jgi:hypothetical protein
MPIEFIISRRMDNARVKITFNFCFAVIVFHAVRLIATHACDKKVFQEHKVSFEKQDHQQKE